MHEPPDLDSIFEPLRLAIEIAITRVRALSSRGLEKEETLIAVSKARAVLEKKLSRRKKVQPLQATIKAAITRTIRQNSKDFPDLPPARLESEGRNVVDTHLDKLRDLLEQHLKAEIESRTKKGTDSARRLRAPDCRRPALEPTIDPEPPKESELQLSNGSIRPEKES
jgi:predicted metal-dependent hydrolase